MSRPRLDAEQPAPRVAVLAGGRGTRLAPFTSVLPKPLMPIGDRSILEIVVDRLAAQGFTDVTLCVGYLSHLIRAVSDHLEENGASITFVQEHEALGTAAPLRLLDDLDDTFVVMNGDVLTTLDFRELVSNHRASGSALTIATRQRTIKVDYGVLHVASPTNGHAINGTPRQVIGFEEKPEVVSTVSMGIYVLEPRALEFIPTDGHFDFPDLVQALLGAGERVGAYLYDGLWFDIGRPDDYEQAVSAWLADEETRNNATQETRTGAHQTRNGAQGRAFDALV
jgi:NDP-sugar pyrophosphorylase family protein